jgi:hypothetical protein
VFRRAWLAVVLLLVSSCHHEGSSDGVSDRVHDYFGSGRRVSPSGITVPKAQIFIAVPDPIPADYDGYDAALVPDDGQPLRGAAAVRFVWANGVRDPESLARVAALFVGNSRQVAHLKDRATTIIRGHESVTDPVAADGWLIFFVVRGSMAPEARQVTLDLNTFAVTERPATSVAVTSEVAHPPQ